MHLTDNEINSIIYYSTMDGKNGMKPENFSYVQQSLEIINKCYSEYKPEDVFLCFNGGKDCTVLLSLTLNVLRLKFPNWKRPLLCMYVQPENPFPEVELFISQCQKQYEIRVVAITDKMKQALGKMLKEHPNLKACLLGTRRTDPFSSNLNHFQMTDPDWPQVLRVSPILDWTYQQVWEYLLTFHVPYCNLYDLGYTSLGSRTNTIPNPELLVADETNKQRQYLPAHRLVDGSKERSGRI